MVLIEPVEQPNVAPPPPPEKKAIPITQTPPKDEPAAAASSSSAADDGYASDGFETASEADLNEENDVVGEELERVVQGVDTLKVELNQKEITEKALAEANNAKLDGNNLFKEGIYEEALLKYNTALEAVQTIPSASELCAACHANRAACYSKLGKFEDTIKECTKALEMNPKYMKVLLRRAEAHEKLEHFEEAITDMTKVLEIDPTNDQARRTAIRLKPLADEKREKMKDEMIGKLKEVGNSILNRFGMSVDNFKTVQDPNTGSYSIQFQR